MRRLRRFSVVGGDGYLSLPGDWDIFLNISLCKFREIWRLNTPPPLIDPRMSHMRSYFFFKIQFHYHLPFYMWWWELQTCHRDFTIIHVKSFRMFTIFMQKSNISTSKISNMYLRVIHFDWSFLVWKRHWLTLTHISNW